MYLWNNPVQASQRKIPILIDAERKGAAGAKFPQVRPCLVHPKNQNIFKIPRHIELAAHA